MALYEFDIDSIDLIIDRDISSVVLNMIKRIKKYKYQDKIINRHLFYYIYTNLNGENRQLMRVEIFHSPIVKKPFTILKIFGLKSYSQKDTIMREFLIKLFETLSKTKVDTSSLLSEFLINKIDICLDIAKPPYLINLFRVNRQGNLKLNRGSQTLELNYFKHKSFYPEGFNHYLADSEIKVSISEAENLNLLVSDFFKKVNSSIYDGCIDKKSKSSLELCLRAKFKDKVLFKKVKNGYRYFIPKNKKSVAIEYGLKVYTPIKRSSSAILYDKANKENLTTPLSRIEIRIHQKDLKKDIFNSFITTLTDETKVSDMQIAIERVLNRYAISINPSIQETKDNYLVFEENPKSIENLNLIKFNAIKITEKLKSIIETLALAHINPAREMKRRNSNKKIPTPRRVNPMELKVKLETSSNSKQLLDIIILLIVAICKGVSGVSKIIELIDKTYKSLSKATIKKLLYSPVDEKLEKSFKRLAKSFFYINNTEIKEKNIYLFIKKLFYLNYVSCSRIDLSLIDYNSNIYCYYCNSSDIKLATSANSKKRYKCNSCNKIFTLNRFSHRMSESDKNKIVYLHNLGMSNIDIAQEVLFSATAIGKFLKKLRK